LKEDDMPMYQYACTTCGQSFEKKLSMAQADEPQACPDCGSADTRKRPAAIALGGQRRAAGPVEPPVRRSPFS
jgi:putative FmdB family regulatory protein